MALCPEDASIVVEDETVCRGTRRSVIISISAAAKGASFGVETVINHKKARISTKVETDCDDGTFKWGTMKLKWKGFLADMLEFAFLRVGGRCESQARK